MKYLPYSISILLFFFSCKKEDTAVNTDMPPSQSVDFSYSGDQVVAHAITFTYKRVYYNYADDSISMIDDNSGIGGNSYYLYRAKK